jgi:hypothetical protein
MACRIKDTLLPSSRSKSDAEKEVTTEHAEEHRTEKFCQEEFYVPFYSTDICMRIDYLGLFGVIGGFFLSAA